MGGGGEGGGQNGPCILQTVIYKGVKQKEGEDWFEPFLNIPTSLPSPFTLIFFCLYITQINIQKKKSIFLFAPLQLSSQTNYS